MKDALNTTNEIAHLNFQFGQMNLYGGDWHIGICVYIYINRCLVACESLSSSSTLSKFMSTEFKCTLQTLAEVINTCSQSILITTICFYFLARFAFFSLSRFSFSCNDTNSCCFCRF